MPLAGSAAAQHATVSTPLQTGSNNYFEQVGVSFNFQGPGFFFQQNSFGLAAPQFGGATPGAGATGGFALPMLGGTAFFNFNASQGSRSSLTSQTPSATLSNGVQGGFFDTTQTPFVANVVPAGDVSPALDRWQQMRTAGARRNIRPPRTPAGDAGPAKPKTFAARLATAQSSSAGRAAMSVAELRDMRAQQSQAAQQAIQQETLALIERGRDAEQGGKLSVARLYYEQAARRCTGPQRDDLLEHAHALAEVTASKKASRTRATSTDKQ